MFSDKIVDLDAPYQWSPRSSLRELDRGMVGGVALAIGLLLIAIVGGHGSVLSFLDFGSFGIVIGGTFGATLVNYSIADIRRAWNALLQVLRATPAYPMERINQLVTLAHAVRAQGLLHLDTVARDESDPFFKKALELTVDGQPAEELRRILETDIRCSAEQGWKAAQVFETMSLYAPAFGLVGTLIGLIQMLGGLDNPTNVGSSMALALVATLYGAVFANLFLLPVAGKVRNFTEEQLRVRAITLEGVISLGKQENAMVLEQRLFSFLPKA